MRGITLLLMCMCVALLAPAGDALAAKKKNSETGGVTADLPPAPSTATGGAEFGVEDAGIPRLYTPGTKAKRLKSGYAAAPSDAPVEVQEAIFAANEIVGKPYVYGGGHRSFKDSGYDCSGTVSYALNGGGWLDAPLPSGNLMSWGARGKGKWVTVYAHGGHTYVNIAGLRLDTSSAGERRSSGKGPRWRKNLRGGGGFVKRHPAGF